MKFESEKSEIVESLQLGASIAERRQTIPILANLKIVAINNSVQITATDLEIQVKINTKVKKVIVEGETTVSARKMSELCRSLPDKEKLEFTLEEGKLTVSSKNFHADFATLSSDDFPILEMSDQGETIEINSSLLKKLLVKTNFCMASQDVRYYLNGLLLEIKDSTLTAVATDGHRLALSSSKLSKSTEKNIRLIIPRKAVLELSKSLNQSDEEVQVILAQSSIEVKNSSMQFTSKLVDGKFPDYEKVFPKGESNKLTVSIENLQGALTRAAVLSNEKYRGVRFQLAKNLLKLTANNPEKESAEEVIEVDYKGAELEIGFNIGYILDVLNSMESEEVELHFFSEESSCLINEPGNESEVYVIMPMRL